MDCGPACLTMITQENYLLVLLNLYSIIIFAEKKTMDCPRCGSINHRKDGIVGGRQRHYCKDCHYRYTVQQKSNTKSAATRRLALEMYTWRA